MKNIFSMLSIAILGGVAVVGVQQYFNVNTPSTTIIKEQSTIPLQPVGYSPLSTSGSGVDFTVAAEKSLNAVVHVKNVSTYRRAMHPFDLFNPTNRGGLEKSVVGAGSGVIISEDGYIVTNNHVISGTSEIKITLNNGRTYDAEIIGKDSDSDIALLKINPENEQLTYLPFGNSDHTKVGEWVLAVGNPFNLTSTVTAGIISAKARDLNDGDNKIQSFIQTDAAINPGNSGGALVNTYGELIGINTAISSQTGSYIGYGFAVTSNNAHKIVEDILEYGNVQKAILGIAGATLSEAAAKELNIDFIQGVLVSSIGSDSGADKAGLKKADVIIGVDQVKVRKFSDLTGYVNSKHPDDIIEVHVVRNGSTIHLPVTLGLYERFILENIGIEVGRASDDELEKRGVEHGVIITKALSTRLKRYGVEGLIITQIDGEKVYSINDVKKIVGAKSDHENTMITFVDHQGVEKHFIFN